MSSSLKWEQENVKEVTFEMYSFILIMVIIKPLDFEDIFSSLITFGDASLLS